MEFCTTELLHEHLSNMWGWRIQNKYFSSFKRYFRQKQRLYFFFKNELEFRTRRKWKSYSSVFPPLFHLCVCLIMLNYADTSSRWADPLFTLEFAYCNKNQTALREIQSVHTMNGGEWWGEFSENWSKLRNFLPHLQILWRTQTILKLMILEENIILGWGHKCGFKTLEQIGIVAVWYEFNTLFLMNCNKKPLD